MDIQSLEGLPGRLGKRPRMNPPLLEGNSLCSFVKNSDSSSTQPRKRPRKARQLPQFNVYQDQLFTTNSDRSSALNELPPVPIKHELGPICPYIAVEIPFRPDLHGISTQSRPKNVIRKPLRALCSIALNGAKKAPKIPRNWLKNQPNDHISKLFLLFSFL